MRGNLTGQRYVDDILRPHVGPFLNGLPGAIFQQDNARPHTAKVAQDFLRHLQTLPWPARFPDLFPVEHVWDQLKRQMPSCHSAHDLELAVSESWAHLPQDNIRCLINSIPDRVAACIAAGGSVFAWRTPAEASYVNCLVPTVKYGGCSIIVWGTISSRELGPLVFLRDTITGDHYQSILADRVQPMLNFFPRERPVFLDDNAPVHMSHYFQTWLHEHDDKVQHLTWCPQSPNMNTIECLWIFCRTMLVLGFLLHVYYLNSRRPYTRNGCEFRCTLFKTIICQSYVECKLTFRSKVA
ncbi:transposable element Tcb2 transposase [Trichonephila clavipes]|nr:transposable element Tcb2 transposase [Trichonephila clavipes]